MKQSQKITSFIFIRSADKIYRYRYCVRCSFVVTFITFIVSVGKKTRRAYALSRTSEGASKCAANVSREDMDTLYTTHTAAKSSVTYGYSMQKRKNETF